MLPRHGPQPHKIVCERFSRLLGDVWWFSAQRRVDRHEVALSCWGLGRVGCQDIRDIALAAPPTQEVVQHTSGQDHISGDQWRCRGPAACCQGGSGICSTSAERISPSKPPRQLGNCHLFSNIRPTYSHSSCASGVCKDIMGIVGVGIHVGMFCIMNGDVRYFVCLSVYLKQPPLFYLKTIAHGTISFFMNAKERVQMIGIAANASWGS